MKAWPEDEWAPTDLPRVDWFAGGWSGCHGRKLDGDRCPQCSRYNYPDGRGGVVITATKQRLARAILMLTRYRARQWR